MEPEKQAAFDRIRARARKLERERAARAAQTQERIADALERIAKALDRSAPPEMARCASCDAIVQRAAGTCHLCGSPYFRKP